MKKVVVVGGGFSGLVTAYYLSRKGMSVELHEASSRLGGLLGSEKTPSGLVERAASSFILNDDLMELFQDLNLDYIYPFKGAKKRFIFRNGIKRWPLKLFETLGLVFKILPRLLFGKSSLRPRDQETVWNWGHRCLNHAATAYFIQPGLQGIYAGDAHRMSAELILGPLFGRKKQKYRGTVSLKNGMEDCVHALEKYLRGQGVQIYLNSPYQIQDLSVPHVICVSGAAVPKVLEKITPQNSALLGKMEILPVLSVTVFFEKPQAEIRGFGVLFPEEEGFKVLGVISNTYIFENRGPRYSETWIFGGVHSPEMLKKSEQEVLEQIQNERSRILKSQDSIVEYRIYPWAKALPHYTLEHKKILQDIKLPKNLYLNGNYMGAIGLSKILVRSKEISHEIA